MKDLDRLDLKILEALQRDGTLTIADLGDNIGLSASPCWKRVKRLESEGYIGRRVALLDASKLGLRLTVFVQIRAGRHDPDWLATFAETVSRMPEVVEFHRLSGQIDYLLKVVLADTDEYNRFYKKLIRVSAPADVSSSIAMEQIKRTTELPLENL